MKGLFTKSISVAFLCMLLTVLMIFGGCSNGGSTATNFFESIKEASEVQKYDFEMDMEFKADTQTASVVVNGTYNSAESMMASATIKSGAMTLKIGEIILDGDRVYLDISDLLSTLGSADVLDGKDYIYIDMSELASLAEMSGAEMPEMDDLSVYQDLSKTITYKLYDILEKAAEDVDPAVLGQDGAKFTFTINKDNMIDYIRNIVNVLADEQDWIFETLPEALDNAGLSDVADLISDNESDIADALEEAVETVKEDPDNPFGEDDEFEIIAYSEMLNEGGRIWNMGTEMTMSSSNTESLFTLNGNGATLSLDMTISENSGDKPITEVDEDNAISYMTLMMSSMSSMYGSDDTSDLYSSLI